MKILSLLGKKKDSTSKARMWAYTDGPFEFTIILFCSRHCGRHKINLRSEVSSHHHVDVVCPSCDEKFKVAAVDFMFAADEVSFPRFKNIHKMYSQQAIPTLIDKIVEQFWEMG